MVERSKAWVGGRLLAGTVGWNPAGGMDVCLLYVLCVVCASGRSLGQRSRTECGVSEGDHETSIMRKLCPTIGCCAVGAKIAFFVVYKVRIY